MYAESQEYGSRRSDSLAGMTDNPKRSRPPLFFHSLCFHTQECTRLAHRTMFCLVTIVLPGLAKKRLFVALVFVITLSRYLSPVSCHSRD